MKTLTSRVHLDALVDLAQYHEYSSVWSCIGAVSVLGGAPYIVGPGVSVATLKTGEILAVLSRRFTANELVKRCAA